MKKFIVLSLISVLLGGCETHKIKKTPPPDQNAPVIEPEPAHTAEIIATPDNIQRYKSRAQLKAAQEGAHSTESFQNQN